MIVANHRNEFKRSRGGPVHIGKAIAELLLRFGMAFCCRCKILEYRQTMRGGLCSQCAKWEAAA
jgi:hypothetical protein